MQKKQRIAFCKSVPLSVLDHGLHLLKGTEHDHGRGLSLFLWLFLQQPVAEVHILRDLERTVRVEKALLCQLAFPVLVVTALIPHGIAGIGIRADVVRDVRDHKLGFRHIVPLEILKIIVV